MQCISSGAKSELSLHSHVRRRAPAKIFRFPSAVLQEMGVKRPRVCVIRPETTAREFDGRCHAAAAANRVPGGDPGERWKGGTRGVPCFSRIRPLPEIP